jgi:hypothetical protein
MAGGDGKDIKPEVVTEYKFAQAAYTHLTSYNCFIFIELRTEFLESLGH